MIQFPWKTSAEPTRRRVSWDCWGSGPHPGQRGGPAGAPEATRRGGEALVTKAVPPDPAEPEGDAAPGPLHSQRLTASARAVATGSQRTTASPSQAKPFKPQRQAEWLLLLGKSIASRLRKPRPDSGQSREGGRTGAGGTARWEPQEAQMSAQRVRATARPCLTLRWSSQTPPRSFHMQGFRARDPTRRSTKWPH